MLEHHAETAANPLHLAAVGGGLGAILVAAHGDELAIDPDLPGIGHFEQVDAAQQGRFAGAAAAEDGDHIMVMGSEGDALEHLEGAEALMQVLDPERLGGRPARRAGVEDGGGRHGDGPPLGEGEVGWTGCGCQAGGVGWV